MNTNQIARVSRGVLVGALLFCVRSVVVGQDTVVTVENTILELIETVDVPAQVTGILGPTDVSEGVVVKRDDLLVGVDDREAGNRIVGSQIALRQAELDAADTSDLDFSLKARAVALAELNRAVEANKKLANTYSEFEMERLRLLVDKSDAEIEKANQRQRLSRLTLELKANELELGELLLEKHQVIAPLGGMIVNVGKRTGEWVKAGDVLFTIVRIDKLRVEGLVPADVAAGLSANDPVSLEVALPSLRGRSFPGNVVFVSPEANPVSGQVRIWAEVDNRDGRLRPGLRGTMTIQTTSDNGR